MTANIHDQRILILDFGSQYTQLIARRVREIGVYCELWAWDVTEEQISRTRRAINWVYWDPKSRIRIRCE